MKSEKIRKEFASRQQQKQKSLDNCLRQARQNGNFVANNMEMEQYPQDLNRFDELNFDLNWWELVPLNKMDLSNNNIKSIPKEISNHQGLVVLRMMNNQISHFPDELFDLKLLKSIDFQHNQIECLPLTLGNCESLVEINFNNNKLSDLPPNISQLQQLESILLQNNLILNIPNVKGLYKLKKLDLSNNQIKIIKSDDLSKLDQLTDLNFSKNQLEIVEYGAFAHLMNLTNLDVADNKLEEWTEVPRSEKLDTLVIAFNRIKKLENLCNAPRLSVLDAKNNKLTVIDPIIAKMRLLKTLDLSNNDLSDLPSELGILPKLTRINIEGNALKTIKSSMRTAGAEVLKKYLVTRIAGTKYLLPKVMSLNQKKNIQILVGLELKLIHGTSCSEKIQLLRKPYLLRIKKQQIYLLNSSNLSCNLIEQLPEEISLLKDLQSLNMNQNKLKDLPLSILELSNLQELELRQNSLTQFFDSMSSKNISMTQIQILDLSFNKLQQVPKIIWQFQFLTKLVLSNNQIKSIEEVFNGNYRLNLLDFSNNRVAILSDNVQKQALHLQYLTFENNDIITIPTIIGFFPCIKQIKLEGNPQKMINQNLLTKGLNQILDFLRLRHQGDIPNYQQQLQEYKQLQQQEEQLRQKNFQKKVEREQEEFFEKQQIARRAGQKVLTNEYVEKINFTEIEKIQNFQKDRMKESRGISNQQQQNFQMEHTQIQQQSQQQVNNSQSQTNIQYNQDYYNRTQIDEQQTSFNNKSQQQSQNIMNQPGFIYQNQFQPIQQQMMQPNFMQQPNLQNINHLQSVYDQYKNHQQMQNYENVIGYQEQIPQDLLGFNQNIKDLNIQNQKLQQKQIFNQPNLQDLNPEVAKLDEQINRMEKEIDQNFSLNKIQLNKMKKDVQLLRIRRNQIAGEQPQINIYY